jgi:hypothetical protein
LSLVSPSAPVCSPRPKQSLSELQLDCPFAASEAACPRPPFASTVCTLKLPTIAAVARMTRDNSDLILSFHSHVSGNNAMYKPMLAKYIILHVVWIQSTRTNTIILY